MNPESIIQIRIQGIRNNAIHTTSRDYGLSTTSKNTLRRDEAMLPRQIYIQSLDAWLYIVTKDGHKYEFITDYPFQ